MSNDKKNNAVNRVPVTLPKGFAQSARAQADTVSRALAQIHGTTAVERLAALYDDPISKFFKDQENLQRLLAFSNPPLNDRVRRAVESATAVSTRFNTDYSEIFGRIQWQESLRGLDRETIDMITGRQTELAKAIERINKPLLSQAEAMKAFEPPISERMARLSQVAVGLDLTGKRMAALAGVTDTYGIGKMHHEALKTLLGGFHTSLDLPRDYWSNFDVRRDVYRDADVDEGLIEADPETTIALGITSGAIAGEITEESARWTVTTASGLVTVSSSNLGGDIFQLVGYIEKTVRKFVATKLERDAGPKWFKERVPGEVRARVKERRDAALKAGERAAEPVDYLTLGELAEIILRKDNWSAVFEPIFREQYWFRRDAEIITAARNPNAHYRANDSVRLLEVMGIWMRLKGWIEDDGDWQTELEDYF